MKISREHFRLSFPQGPQFHITTSSKTGKKIITCTLKGVIRQPELENGYIAHMFNRYSDENIIVVTSRAVCSANDTYAENVGKAVAAAKAESKAYAKAVKVINSRLEEITNTFQSAAIKFEDKANGVIEHNANYINDVTNPESDLYKRKTQTC